MEDIFDRVDKVAELAEEAKKVTLGLNDDAVVLSDDAIIERVAKYFAEIVAVIKG